MQDGYDHLVLEEQTRKTEKLAEALTGMSKIVLDQLKLPDLSARLHGRAETVRADKFRVVVVGAFSRGKSTLMNALLGDVILPQKVNPSTAIITVVEYAEKPSVRIKYHDGKPDRDNVTVEDFCSQFVLNESDMSEPRGSVVWELHTPLDDKQGSAEASPDMQHETPVVLHDRFSDIDHAVVYYPLELCRHGVEVVDSPGLQAHPLHTARTLKFLKTADAVVMVLDATALLDQQERHFLETVLLPQRLHNIFFLVNKWNLIEHHVLRPQDLKTEYERLNQRIREQLTPYCVVNGIDRSAERIFRVNLFGAVKARLQRPIQKVDLESSGVPAFEVALQKFLVNEKGRARNDVVLGVLKSTADEVRRFINTELSSLNKSISEIEAEGAAIQPKLDRLRGIKSHIEGFLDAKSSNLQDNLALSFQSQIRKIEENLPEAVNNFDLRELTKGVMIWTMATDWLKSDENKFAKKVERHLMPQITRFLEKELAVWHEAVRTHVLPAVAIDIDKHLEDEAKEYQRVLHEIEERLGIEGNTLQIRELVRNWLGGAQTPGEGGDSLVGTGAGMAVVGDLGFLVAGVVTDIASEVLLHMSTVWIPIIGALVTAIRLALREYNIRQEMAEKIIQGVREKLRDLESTRSAKIRDDVKQDFNRLKANISGSIEAEIALIDAGLQDILARKRESEFSAEREKHRLDGAQIALNGEIQRVRAALV